MMKPKFPACDERVYTHIIIDELIERQTLLVFQDFFYRVGPATAFQNIESSFDWTTVVEWSRER